MCLFCIAVLGGQLATLAKLPSLMGMLVVGIIFSSVPGINYVGSNIDKEFNCIDQHKGKVGRSMMLEVASEILKYILESHASLTPRCGASPLPPPPTTQIGPLPFKIQDKNR